MSKIKLPQVYLMTFTDGTAVAMVAENCQDFIASMRNKGHALIKSEPVA